MSKQRRTEDYGIRFVDGQIDGWAFGVPEAFRDQLDILYLARVDKEKSRELRAKHLKPDGHVKSTTVHRMAWSRGVPPVRRFDVGHIFYNPPEARAGQWSDALRILKATIQIKEARPDGEFSDAGWVKFELTHYDRGEISTKGTHTTSQADFETLLQTGSLPEGIQTGSAK